MICSAKLLHRYGCIRIRKRGMSVPNKVPNGSWQRNLVAHALLKRSRQAWNVEGSPGPGLRLTIMWVSASILAAGIGFNIRLPGLDNWVGLNYAWVKFDAGSQLEVGGAASGEFMVFFDGTENASRLIVRGRFDVSKFKQDTWGTPYLPTIKFEESGTTPCGLSPEDA